MHSYCPNKSRSAESRHGVLRPPLVFRTLVTPVSVNLRQTFLSHEMTAKDDSVETPLKETASTQGCGLQRVVI